MKVMQTQATDQSSGNFMVAILLLPTFFGPPKPHGKNEGRWGPQNMGVITPKHEGKVGSHGSSDCKCSVIDPLFFGTNF